MCSSFGITETHCDQKVVRPTVHKTVIYSVWLLYCSTNRSVELRGNITKRLVSNGDFLESLDRFEIQGGPVWGI